MSRSPSWTDLDGSFIPVAKITKPKGVCGKLVVAAPEGLSLRVCEGLEVWVVPPTLRGVRRTAITELNDRGKACELTLDGLDDANAAGELAGRYLLAAASQAPPPLGADGLRLPAWADVEPELPGDGHMPQQGAAGGCVGMRLVDIEAGEIGVVARVEDSPAHPLLVVEQAAGTVWVPYVDEFIVGREGERLSMRLPKGLLEVNRKKASS
jgi:16S rRNA processing protein RimM